MGLKEIFSRLSFTKKDDERLVERAQEETRMAPLERDVDQEDFEGRKEDMRVREDFASSEALDIPDE